MKGIFGLSEKMSAAFAYVGVFVTGIITLVAADREDKNLRFHGLQSLTLFGLLFLVRMLIGWIWILGPIISWVLGVVIFVSWIGLTLAAYMGIKVKIPIIGDACWAYVNKSE